MKGTGVDFTREGPDATRAIVLHVEPKSSKAKTAFDREAASKLEEAIGLAEAIDLQVAKALIAPLVARRPATYIGSGKVEELAKLVEETEAELVVVNAQLSPIQQRNLETAWKCKVLDRTGLILEIFGRRATSREGALQVELAHLQYQRSRLVRSWTHLERQRGGFGFLGGPGESQLEADRRLIQERISKIEGELEGVVKTRTLHRLGRDRVPFPIVALVGYTNAGKSTLFNRLTDANVLAKDLLFATLDPTMRNVVLPSGRKIILSDTVGFISELPTTLVAAFRSTLEEVLGADVILHVRDIAHHETEAQALDVGKVLGDLGLPEEKRTHLLEVWNKSDLLSAEERSARRFKAERADNVALASAVTGDGIPKLLDLIENKLSSTSKLFELTLAPEDGRGLAWAYERGEVVDRQTLDDGRSKIRLRLAENAAGQAAAKFGKALREKR